MCYTQAASAGARMVQALRSGILVLIFPPMGICIGLMVMSYKKRNRFQDRDADRKTDLGW
jgi:4-hydroxybenzoate polyprenyltransferase